MSENDAKPLSETEKKIVDAAIGCFVHFGVRKSSMNDIAAEAGVSRQTLYDVFGNKDALIRASIRSITDRNLNEVRAQLVNARNLSEQLVIYLESTILKSFELLQRAREPEDLVTGHNKAGKEEILRSHRLHEALLAELLTPYADALNLSGESPQSVARVLVTSAMGLKTAAHDRDDLLAQLSSLKTMVLTLAGIPPKKR